MDRSGLTELPLEWVSEAQPPGWSSEQDMQPNALLYPALPVLPLTPLPFAWYAVLVSIHLYARAVLQEKSGFVAGGHLRAARPSVALEAR
jgi:hypothetical protein